MQLFLFLKVRGVFLPQCSSAAYSELSIPEPVQTVHLQLAPPNQQMRSEPRKQDSISDTRNDLFSVGEEEK